MSHCIERTNEKETLKKEYLGRLSIVFDTELSRKNKIQAIGSLAIPVLDTILELLTGAQKNFIN